MQSCVSPFISHTYFYRWKNQIRRISATPFNFSTCHTEVSIGESHSKSITRVIQAKRHHCMPVYTYTHRATPGVYVSSNTRVCNGLAVCDIMSFTGLFDNLLHLLQWHLVREEIRLVSMHIRGYVL